MAEESFLTRFMYTVCGLKAVFYHLLALEVAILVILLFSVVTLEPGGAAYVLLQIDLLALAIALAITISAILYCKDY